MKPTKPKKVRRTHQERAADAERLMASLANNAEPVTITETGEVQDGAASDLMASEGEYSVRGDALGMIEEYGGCPTCAFEARRLKNDAQLWIGREVWSVCDEHHVKWFSRLDSWFTGSPDEDEWDANDTRLQGYRRVEGMWPVTDDPDDVNERETSYNRLWMFIRSTHTDRALLAWILDTHTDLPKPLSWLIRRQMAEGGPRP